MSGNELKAREFLATHARIGIFPMLGPQIDLTDAECINIAKNLPWHWTDIQALFKSYERTAEAVRG